MNNAAAARKYQNSSRQVYSTINREFPSKMSKSVSSLLPFNQKKFIFNLIFLYLCTSLNNTYIYKDWEQMPAFL